jgi:hypothetical protein
MHVRSFENEVKSFEAIVAFVLSLLATVAHISNWSGEYREHFVVFRNSDESRRL